MKKRTGLLVAVVLLLSITLYSFTAEESIQFNDQSAAKYAQNYLKNDFQNFQSEVQNELNAGNYDDAFKTILDESVEHRDFILYVMSRYNVIYDHYHGISYNQAIKELEQNGISPEQIYNQIFH
jgi:hypothetical protein